MISKLRFKFVTKSLFRTHLKAWPSMSRQYCTTTALRSQIRAVSRAASTYRVLDCNGDAALTIARLAAHRQDFNRAKRHHDERAENKERTFAFHRFSLRNRFVHLFTRQKNRLPLRCIKCRNLSCIWFLPIPGNNGVLVLGLSLRVGQRLVPRIGDAIPLFVTAK